MRSLIRNVIFGCGATVVMLGASAPVFGQQDWRNRQYANSYRENAGGVGVAEGRRTVIQTVEDLNRVISNYNLPGWERAKLAEARRDMFEFRDRFVRDGQFDRHELSEAIETIDGVVRNALLNPRDRDALAHDVTELRELRGGVSFDNRGARDEYGYNGQPYVNPQVQNQPYGNRNDRGFQRPQNESFGNSQGYGYNGYRR